MVADPVVVSLTLRNVSAETRGYVLSNEWADYELVVKDAHGSAVSLTPDARRRAAMGHAFMRVVMELRPKGEFETRIILNRFFNLTKSGVYTVTARRRGVDAAGLVASNPFPIRIRE